MIKLRREVVPIISSLALGATVLCLLPALAGEKVDSVSSYLDQALDSISQQRASISIMGRALSPAEVARLDKLAQAAEYIGKAKTLLSQEDRIVGVQTGVGVAVPAVVHPDRGLKNRKTRLPNKPATEPDTDLEKAFQKKYGFSSKDKVLSYVKQFASKSKFPSLARSRLLVLKDKELEQQFPERVIYVLRFMQWPVAVPVPQGLASNTILIVDKKGVIKKILDEARLKQFFTTYIKESTAESDTRNLLAAWLLMAKELAQDGMYQFQAIDKSSFQITKTEKGISATGEIKIIARGGNEGKVLSVLNFDKTGRLENAKIIKQMRAGIRPICQSHKLLDKDPVIRKMAEQDLLVMGKMCKDYLFEQRKRVSPALQKAIDKIWARILDRSNAESIQE